MTASLEITIPGADAVEIMLEGLVARVSNFAPLTAAIRDTLVSSTRERFETNISPAGQRWKPSLGAQLRGTPTLVEHGRLRDSITGASDASSVQVGTNDIRAAIHQLGGVIRPKTASALRFRLANGQFRTVQQVTIPARPFLGLSAEDRDEIDGLAADFMAAAEA